MTSSYLLTGPIVDPDFRLGGVIDHPRACFPIPPYGYFPRPTHRDSTLHPCAMRTRGFLLLFLFLSLSLHTLSTLVLDFSFEG